MSNVEKPFTRRKEKAGDANCTRSQTPYRTLRWERLSELSRL